MLLLPYERCVLMA